MAATLGERELDVMGVLWRDGARTVAEVRDLLPARLAYNTVLTILRNLESKGFVDHTAEGRIFRYAPAVSEHTVRRSAFSRLVDTLFRGSPGHAVAHFVENEKLSRDELQSLHRLLEERLSVTRQNRGSARSNAPAVTASQRRPRSHK